VKVIWAVLCQTSVIDKLTNNLSLFNIVEEINVVAEVPQATEGKDNPIRIPIAIELVTLWSRTDREVKERGYGRIKLVQPASEETTTPEYEIDLTEFLRTRNRMRMTTIPIKDNGIYRYIVEGRSDVGEWEQMFEVPLSIVIQKKET